MKLVSWNLNGIRAVAKKGLNDIINNIDADVICFQETKAQDDQVLEALEGLKGYYIYSNSAVKKGYSGTAILSKSKPISIKNDIGIEEHDLEGRVICAEYESFFIVTVYVPNSGSGLKKLDYRQGWDLAFANYLQELEKTKPVIVCGDLNVAHQSIDLKNDKSNYNKTAGYTQTEIDGLQNILNQGFVDTFRDLHPEVEKYSWWSYRMNAREKNVGWRIDYFLVSQVLSKNIQKAEIHNDIFGSDHCPVSIEL